MPDFWDKVLGTPQQQESAPQQQSDIPWWQRTTISTPARQTPPQQQPQPDENSAPSAQPDESASMARTQWAQQTTGRCPSCQSSNYAAHPEAPEARARCYDCGYPISQSGTGITLRGDMPVREARQTRESRTSSFNPKHIFQHLG
jgi:hypothetical protein